MKTSQSFKNPYERMYSKSLTTEQVAEMQYNLTKYVEMLIQLDHQNKEWLKQHKQEKPDYNISGSKKPT